MVRTQYSSTLPSLQKERVHLTYYSRRNANCKNPPPIGGSHFMLCQRTNIKDKAICYFLPQPFNILTQIYHLPYQWYFKTLYLGSPNIGPYWILVKYLLLHKDKHFSTSCGREAVKPSTLNSLWNFTPIAIALKQLDISNILTPSLEAKWERQRGGEDTSKHSAPPPLHPSQPRSLLSRLNLVILPPPSPPSFALNISSLLPKSWQMWPSQMKDLEILGNC